MYPDPKNKGQQLPSARYTTKYYCVKRRCILARFPCIKNTFLEIPKQVMKRLKQSHLNVPRGELSFKGKKL